MIFKTKQHTVLHFFSTKEKINFFKLFSILFISFCLFSSLLSYKNHIIQASLDFVESSSSFIHSSSKTHSAFWISQLHDYKGSGFSESDIDVETLKQSELPYRSSNPMLIHNENIYFIDVVSHSLICLSEKDHSVIFKVKLPDSKFENAFCSIISESEQIFVAETFKGSWETEDFGLNESFYTNVYSFSCSNGSMIDKKQIKGYFNSIVCSENSVFVKTLLIRSDKDHPYICTECLLTKLTANFPLSKCWQKELKGGEGSFPNPPAISPPPLSHDGRFLSVTGGTFSSTPELYKSKVVEQFAPCYIHFLNEKTGEVIKSIESKDCYTAAPCTIEGKNVFFARTEVNSNMTKISSYKVDMMLNKNSVKERWTNISSRLPVGWGSAPYIHEDFLVLLNRSGGINGINKDNGEWVWNQIVGSSSNSFGTDATPYALTKSNVFTSGINSTGQLQLKIININTGKIEKEYFSNEIFNNNPRYLTISNNSIYITFLGDNRIICHKSPPKPPKIQINPSEFSENLFTGDCLFRNFSVFNIGESELEGSITTKTPWLRIAKTSFSKVLHNEYFEIPFFIDSSYFQKEIDIIHKIGNINITSNGGNFVLPVNIQYIPPPHLIVTPTNITETIVVGYIMKKILTLNVTGDVGMKGKVLSKKPWIKILEENFNDHTRIIQIELDATNLKAGIYKSELVFRTDCKTNQVVTIPVIIQCATKIVFSIGSNIMLINSKKEFLDSAPFILEQRSYLPIRKLVENIPIVDHLNETSINWYPDEDKIVIHSENISIVLFINNPKAIVNDKVVLIDENNKLVVPLIENGRTFLPLRFIAENIGFDVSWNSNTQTVTLLYTPTLP